MSLTSPTDATAIADTQEWLQKAVIGLNLCPFAKPVVVQKLVRYIHSAATSEEALLEILLAELQFLAATPITEVETTLIIHPQILNDFAAYNDFLGVADDMLVELKLDGVIQVASFHPRYQFAGTTPDDITNYTNRSPYPTLHLLREDSVSRAVDSNIDVDAIPDKNIETLTRLGLKGWQDLKIPEGT